MVHCPVCNGFGVVLGTLVTTWYRCQDCGTTFMGEAQDTGWGDDTTEAVARAIGLID